MKRVVLIFMSLLFFLNYPIMAHAQEIKDAFVLVDVSGSMRYSTINQEAKQIIGEMLQGRLSLSEFPGWSRVTTIGLDGSCPLLSDSNDSFIARGGKVCIMPFGNMERVRDYRWIEANNFQSSFDLLFPTTFNDQWTYMTLAKSYVVHVASDYDISGMVYMIIYSDGAEESMDGTVSYTDEFRTIVDYFGTCNDSFCQKKGILRKSYNHKDFDIEIWTLGPIPPKEVASSASTSTQESTPAPVTPPIKISNQSKGKSPKDPIEVKLKDPVSLQWINGKGKVKINVQRKKGNQYTNIPASDKKNHYIVDQKNKSATITFYNAHDYRVIVADSNSRDERYFKVTGNSLAVILPFLLIVFAIIAVILLWRMLKPKRSNSDSDNNNDKKPDNDW